MVKFSKKYKKLKNYYLINYFNKKLHFLVDKNIIFLNLNSFENIQVYLLKNFAINLNNFQLVALNVCKYKYLIKFYLLGWFPLMRYTELKRNLCSYLKSFNYMLITDNKALDYKKLKQINNLMLINNDKNLKYLNFMYIKLNTHTQACSFNYLLNFLLKNYGKSNIFTFSLIIHLLNFNSIKLLKLLYLNTKII